MEDKILGMLAGVALGDALGSPWERGAQAKRLAKNPELFTGELDSYISNFNFYTKETKNGVIGQVSDDTEMTLALCNSIIEKGDYDPDCTTMHYLDFANSCPFLGKNTRALFHGVKTLKGYKKRMEGASSSQGNGSLMRASPLAIFKSSRRAIEDCRLSNPNPDNEACAKVYHSILRAALKGEIATIEMDEKTDWEEAVTGDKKGWCYVSLYLYSLLQNESFFQKNSEKTFRRTMKFIANHKGDIDTNMAIIGATVGARIGFEKMMEDQVTKANWEKVINSDPSEGDYPRSEHLLPRRIPEIAKELAELYQE
jgi:ADP-ribosylglycohydrolase